MKISELSGDSSVTDVAFSSGEIKCKFEDAGTGSRYSISVPTQAVYSQGSAESDSVHIRIIELREVLPIEPNSQIYLAPHDFGLQMRAAREGFLLAVGLKSTDWPLFLQIRGYRILVASPLQSEESICIQPIE